MEIFQNHRNNRKKIVEKITHKTQKAKTCTLIVDTNCLSLRLFIDGKLCI